MVGIISLVSSVSYIYQVNGFLSNILDPQRGLKKEDFLSPYLFILVFDVLFRMLMHGRVVQDIKGVDISKIFPQTHLFLLMMLLFAKATQDIRNWFSKAFGQKNQFAEIMSGF